MTASIKAVLDLLFESLSSRITIKQSSVSEIVRVHDQAEGVYIEDIQVGRRGQDTRIVLRLCVDGERALATLTVPWSPTACAKTFRKPITTVVSELQPVFMGGAATQTMNTVTHQNDQVRATFAPVVEESFSDLASIPFADTEAVTPTPVLSLESLVPAATIPVATGQKKPKRGTHKGITDRSTVSRALSVLRASMDRLTRFKGYAGLVSRTDANRCVRKEFEYTHAGADGFLRGLEDRELVCYAVDPDTNEETGFIFLRTKKIEEELLAKFF